MKPDLPRPDEFNHLALQAFKEVTNWYDKEYQQLQKPIGAGVDQFRIAFMEYIVTTVKCYKELK